MSTLYRGPPIDASYQVLVHLAKWFQRRRILKISQSETRIAFGVQDTIDLLHIPDMILNLYIFFTGVISL
jgi:hypothetical protein